VVRGTRHILPQRGRGYRCWGSARSEHIPAIVTDAAPCETAFKQWSWATTRGKNTAQEQWHIVSATRRGLDREWGIAPSGIQRHVRLRSATATPLKATRRIVMTQTRTGSACLITSRPTSSMSQLTSESMSTETVWIASSRPSAPR